MYASLSAHEREALARFVAKLVEDVDKVASLLESRGTDAALPRAAQANLQRTLECLQLVERFEIPLRSCASEQAGVSEHS